MLSDQPIIGVVTSVPFPIMIVSTVRPPAAILESRVPGFAATLWYGRLLLGQARLSSLGLVSSMHLLHSARAQDYPYSAEVQMLPPF